MSSGEGQKSRIYKTTDGGKTWKLQYSGTTSEFFLDSMACDSETHCVALSDPVNGKFVVLGPNRWRALVGASPRQNASGACQRGCVRGQWDRDCVVRSWRNLFRDRWASSASLSFARSRPVMDSFRDANRQRHSLQRHFQHCLRRPGRSCGRRRRLGTRITTSASRSTPMTPEPHGTSRTRNRAATGRQ